MQSKTISLEEWDKTPCQTQKNRQTTSQNIEHYQSDDLLYQNSGAIEG